eukprot:m.164608 g.164608  ORF g.164608 m.164608 type:complete len:635 (-) comp14403_c0_seq1:133-2037(-)
MAFVARSSLVARRALQHNAFARVAVASRSMGIQYKAPLEDINFVCKDVLKMDEHYKKIGKPEVAEMREAIVEEAARFSEEVLVPIVQVGDKEGCKLDPKTKDVKTPTGWKEAYQTFIEGGWQTLGVPEKYGGQGLPSTIGMLRTEVIASANWAWGMYPGLSVGCMNTLIQCASEEQKQEYLPKLAEGTWSGTMCLTEPQCGTDLGQVKTKAVKQADGSYKLTGTKIFISCGEHDFTENIVHIVLAKTPNAPEGTAGLSLFVVPKYLKKEDGTLSKEKNLTCGGLESKMGIHGSSTCIMNFEDSTGWMIGPENKGLAQMFVFMNTARIGTAVQGLAAAELAYQGALTYAKERKSMRSLSGTKEPQNIADGILHHGDVRKNILTCKAVAEGLRMMIFEAAMTGDYMELASSPEEYKKLDNELGFYTPVLKGFGTEMGFMAANLGLQCFGGHGFIWDHGMEQNVRDTRIATLYEGTTGIQAIDLLGRKIMLKQMKPVMKYGKELLTYCRKQIWDNRETSQHKMVAFKLGRYTFDWLATTGRIAYAASQDRDSLGCASVDYMMQTGYISMGYAWLRMMDVASAKLAEGGLTDAQRDFYKGKLQTGQFFFDHMLPRADGHKLSAIASAKSIMDTDAIPV